MISRMGSVSMAQTFENNIILSYNLYTIVIGMMKIKSVFTHIKFFT